MKTQIKKVIEYENQHYQKLTDQFKKITNILKHNLSFYNIDLLNQLNKDISLLTLTFEEIYFLLSLNPSDERVQKKIKHYKNLNNMIDKTVPILIHNTINNITDNDTNNTNY